jgi:putative phage-type endonuclease
MNEQRSPGWFAERQGKITGSTVGAILGVSSLMTSEDVLKRIVRGALQGDGGDSPNIAMQWGIDNEDNALALVSLETEIEFQKCGFITHPTHDWFGSSPDALYENENQELSPVEVKCPYSRKIVPLSEREDYWHQVQAHLFVTGADQGIYAVWTPTAHHIEFVDCDLDWWKKVETPLKRFHEQVCELINNPELAEPYLTDAIVDRDDEYWQDAVTQYRLAVLSAQKAEDAQKKARDTLIKMAGGISTRGNGVIVRCTKARKVVDYKQAALFHGVPLDPFTKTSKEFWTIKEI